MNHTLLEYSNNWRQGLLSNPFQLLSKIPLDEREDVIPKIVAKLLESTNGNKNIEGKTCALAETAILEALFYYLKTEAHKHPEEQNLLMLNELLSYAKIDDDSNYYSETDVDRLFNMFASKKGPEHIAFKKYNEFKEICSNTLAHNLVLDSCKKRLFPLFNSDDKSVFYNIKDSSDIHLLAYALIMNQYKAGKLPKSNILKNRIVFLIAILSYFYHNDDIYPPLNSSDSNNLLSVSNRIKIFRLLFKNILDANPKYARLADGFNKTLIGVKNSCIEIYHWVEFYKEMAPDNKAIIFDNKPDKISFDRCRDTIEKNIDALDNFFKQV